MADDRSSFTAEERELGLPSDISRRDFVGAAAIGVGATLLAGNSPAAIKAAAAGVAPDPWTGTPGIGDYAISNGNTWNVVSAGHGIRDTLYEQKIAQAVDTGETYDLVIVGGGLSGLIGAYTFLKDTNRQRQCLILENHPILGGEAKRNEFTVRGHKLIGPQGSNETDLPQGGWRAEMWHDIGMPGALEYSQLPAGSKPMQFPADNYRFTFLEDRFENHGFYFLDQPDPKWITNPWAHGLEGMPWSAGLKRDMLRWRDEPVAPFQGDQPALERWLDSMTYEQFLVRERGLDPAVARYADPLLASEVGLGADVISAFAAWSGGHPGFQGLSSKFASRRSAELHSPGPKTSPYSFPGGNDAMTRALVKWINPATIEGGTSFADIHNGRMRFDQFDQSGQTCRMRCGALVVRVVQDPEAPGKGRGQPAELIYIKDGRPFKVRARTIVWAGGSWTGKHAIANLPETYQTAINSYHRSPMMIVNVALDNWRAMYDLGYTAFSYRGGLGFSANLRAHRCRSATIGRSTIPISPIC
jgi:spermidine dehydrogenase